MLLRSCLGSGVLRHSDISLYAAKTKILNKAGTGKEQVAYNTGMFPAVFLDRDGVLIENRSDYVREWSHVKLLPNVLEALAGFQQYGFKIVVVTNQSAVGRGLITLQTAQAINVQLVKMLKEKGGWVDGVYMCPHKPEDQCMCRKPLPGLLLQAASELTLDLASSWMIGDAWSDVLAGQAAGVSGTVLVRTGRGAAQLLDDQPEGIRPFLVSNDLFDAWNSIALPGKDSGYAVNSY